MSLFLTIEWTSGSQCWYGPVNNMISNPEDGLLWLKFDERDEVIPLCNIKRIIIDKNGVQAKD